MIYWKKYLDLKYINKLADYVFQLLLSYLQSKRLIERKPWGGPRFHSPEGLPSSDPNPNLIGRLPLPLWQMKSSKRALYCSIRPKGTSSLFDMIASGRPWVKWLSEQLTFEFDSFSIRHRLFGNYTIQLTALHVFHNYQSFKKISSLVNLFGFSNFRHLLDNFVPNLKKKHIKTENYQF